MVRLFTFLLLQYHLQSRFFRFSSLYIYIYIYFWGLGEWGSEVRLGLGLGLVEYDTNCLSGVSY